MTAPVVVAGAGPAGATTALRLAVRGVPTVLVDPGEAPPEHGIAERLPGSTVALLRGEGLGGLLDEHETAVGTVTVWSGFLRERKAVSEPHGPGVIVDRARFDAALRAAALQAGAQLVEGRIRSVDREHEGLVLDGPVQSASFLVDCTGRTAVLARQLGAERIHDAPSIAWCRWQTDAHPDRRRWIEHTQDGWWYTAPAPGGQRVVVWHRPTASKVDVPRFEQELARAPQLAERCEGAWLTEPEGRAAGGQRLNRVWGEAWCAVGDAAIAFDPISSLGLHSALSGALQVARAIESSLRGDDAPRQRYEARVTQLRAHYQRVHTLMSRAPTPVPRSRSVVPRS